MPKFGDYETIDEPIRITEGAEYVATLWQARRSPSQDTKVYLVKSFGPRRLTSSPGEPSTHASKDSARLLEFLEGVNQLKTASSKFPEFLAPIRDSGLAEGGAWYVTDFYPRKTLQEFINLQGGMESKALEHVVYSVAAGCLALQRATGRSHGNVKPSNVLLAGKPQPLRRTPIHLTDPHSVKSLAERPLRPADAQDPAKQLQDQTEKADLRAIGELILQMVEGRIVRSGYDYNYPVPPSAPWNNIGKDAELWRQRCNQLLKPQLKLSEISLNALENDLRPRPMERHFRRIAAGSALAVLVLIGLLIVRHKPDQPVPPPAPTGKQDQWQFLVNSARAEEKAGNWGGVSEMLNQARMLAQELKDPALGTQTEQYLSYAKAMLAGSEYKKQSNADEALRQAEKALQIPHEDSSAAAGLKNWAEAEVAANKTRGFQRLMAQAKQAEAQDQWRQATNLLHEAEAQGGLLNDPSARAMAAQELRYALRMEAGERLFTDAQWQLALNEALKALELKKGDSKADSLRSRASIHLIGDSTTSRPPPPPPTVPDTTQPAPSELAFQTAVQSARTALDAGQYQKALEQAQAALAIHSTDARATRMKADAQRELNFQAALEAAQQAFNTGQFSQALEQAQAALAIHNQDAKALRLKSDAQAELNFQTVRQAAQKAFDAGQFGKALEQAQTALTIHSADPEAARIKAAAQNELNFQAARQAAQKAFDAGQLSKALEHAQAALAIHSADPEAARIKADAQNELNFQAALQRAEAALGRANFPEAITQADNALAIHPNHKRAGEIRAAAQQRISADARYRAATTAFEQGEYSKALAICQPFRGTDRFDQVAQKTAEEASRLQRLEQALTEGAYAQALQTSWPDKPPFNHFRSQATTENAALQDAHQRLTSGDYTFVASLRQEGYTAKPPFKSLLETARSESNTLQRLLELKQGERRQALRGELAGLAPDLLRKKPFADLLSWVGPEPPAPPAGAPDVTLSDEALAYWEVFLGVKPRPPGSDVQPTRDPNSPANRPYYLGKIDKLERDFLAAGRLDAQRKQRIGALRVRLGAPAASQGPGGNQ